MQELRRTAERTARMYECWRELDAWQRASSSTVSSADAAGALPVRLVNGLARILQSPADTAAMSLIWAAWEMHLQPWTESGARQLGGEGTALVTQLPASASAARVAALPAQEAAAAMHYQDVDAHADLQQPHHQQPWWQQPNKKPPQVIIGDDPDDNRPQAGHLDTWPPTPSPPGSSACKSHESGDEHDEETMDGPGSSGLPRTSLVSQTAAAVGRGDTEGGPYAWQQQQARRDAAARPQFTEEDQKWVERLHQWLLRQPQREVAYEGPNREGLGVPQRFLDRKGLKLFWFLDSFKDLWTLELPVFADKQAVLLHAVPKHQQPAADIAVGVVMQETEGQYVRRLYQHLLEKLPLGVEMNNLKGGSLRIPSHLFGGSYRTVSAFLRHWRDVGLWRMSEDRPLVLTARTGGRVQEVLEGLH
eukprot:XP_001693600.1 predicted protein [Chlamydomonas reinhardtii]